MGTFITMVCAVVTGLWLHDWLKRQRWR